MQTGDTLTSYHYNPIQSQHRSGANLWKLENTTIISLGVPRRCTIHPFEARTCPLDSRRPKLPEFLYNRHMKVVRLSALWTCRLYPKEISLIIISVTGRVDPKVTVWAEGSNQWKIFMKPSGNEPATFPLVVQCLEATACPLWDDVSNKYCENSKPSVQEIFSYDLQQDCTWGVHDLR